MVFQLRDYQKRAVQDCLDFIRKYPKGRAGLCVLPTAAGKSLCISELSHKLRQPVLALAPSKELVQQNYDKYMTYSNDAGIYSASLKRKEIGTVTFGTIGSVISAADKFRAIGVKVLIVDEAHIGSSSENKIYALCKKIGIQWVIGMTATPIILKTAFTGGAELRMMNRSRDSFFQEIFHVTQISELTLQGYWSKVNYMPVQGIKENMLRYNTTGKEFTEESLKRFSEENDILGKIKIAHQQLKIRGRKKILIFMPTVQESFDLSAIIVGSRVIHGGTKDTERDFIVNDFMYGNTDTVINVNVLGTGFDFPLLDAGIHARPTNSASLWYQHVGRFVRIHKDKKDADLIDLSGNFKRFGMVEDFTFEDDPTHKWSMFSGNRKLTNVDLRFGRPEYKTVQKLANKEYECYFWPFGKHKGTEMSLLPKEYLKWVSSDEFQPTYSSAIQAKNRAIKFLSE